MGANAPVAIMNLQTAGKTVNFNGNVNAGVINFAANATANLTDTLTISGSVNNTSGGAGVGILQFQGGGLVTGNIGNTAALSLININSAGGIAKTVELDGSLINAVNIFINDDGSGNPANGTTLKLNNALMALTADITPNTNNEDTLDVTNAASITGNIAKNNQSLNLLKIGLHNDLAISGNIFASTTQFQGNNALTLADGNTINGAVDTTTPGTGTLQFLGGGRITGNIGFNNSLSHLNINSGGGAKQLELNGSVINVNTINTIGDNVNPTTLLLNSAGAMSITGSIIPNISNNLDILNIANTGATTIKGNIGAAGKAFNVIKVGQNNNTTINGNVIATTTQFQANNTLSLGDANTITGAVDSIANGVGILQFQGSGRLTGNVGNTNSLNLISLNSSQGLNKIVELNGAIIKANTINIVGNSATATTLLLNSPGAMALTGNITTNRNNVDILNVANSAATTINGNIGQAGNTFNLIKVNQNASTTINGNIYAALTQLQGNNTLFLGPNSIVNGAIDSISAGTGTLQFLGNSTVTGDIGDASLAAVNIAGAGSVVNLQGNVIANTVNFLADATANLSNDKLITGPVLTSVNNQGTLVFLGNSTIASQIGGVTALKLVSMQGAVGSIVNLNNNIFASNVNVPNGGTLLVNAPRTINGNLSVDNGSVLSLSTAAKPLTVTGDFNLSSNSALALNMAGSLATGLVDAKGIATVDAGAKVVISNPPGNIPGGSIVIPIVLDGAGLGANLHSIPVISTSLVNHFVTEVNGNELDLVITIESLSSPSSSGMGCQGNAVANTISSLLGTTVSGTLGEILNQLGVFSDEATLCAALSSLAPINDGAVVFESFEAQRQTFDVLEERIKDIQYCRHHPKNYMCKHRYAGLSAGDWEVSDERAWVKVYGYTATQEERQEIQGYKDSMSGIALGADFMLSDASLLGAALSWTNFDLAHDVLFAGTQANSYQGLLYGSYFFDNPFFIHWYGGLAYNNYATNYQVNFADLSYYPTENYHGWQSGIKGELGYQIESEYFQLIPLTSLFFSHLNLSEYTQRNADTADLQINDEDYNMLLWGIGFKIFNDYAFSKVLYQPEIHLLSFYDIIGDSMRATAQFIGGGPSFETFGFKPAQASINLGGSLAVFLGTNVVLSIKGDWYTKEEYQAWAGSIRLNYEY